MDEKSKAPSPIRVSVAKFNTPHPEEARTVSIGTRITPREKRLMDIMMREAKGKLPWETESDFHYWCFHQGLKQSTETLKSERFTNQHKQMTMEYDLLDQAEERRKLLHMLKALRAEVEANDALNAQSQVPPLLRKFEANLLSMERSYWTERIKKEFYRDFGARLRSDRISPRPRDAEKEEEE